MLECWQRPRCWTVRHSRQHFFGRHCGASCFPEEVNPFGQMVLFVADGRGRQRLFSVRHRRSPAQDGGEKVVGATRGASRVSNAYNARVSSLRRVESNVRDPSRLRGGMNMAVARSDEGPGNVTRRRMPRKPNDGPPISTPTLPPATPRAAPSGSSVLRLDDLYRLPMPKLFALAEREGIAEHTGMTRGQLIVAVVRRQIERGEVVRGSGTLEVLPDGYGFLRSAAHNYLASPEDIYVSPSQIRRPGLRTGLVVEGPIRLPVEGQENFALMQVEAINSHTPEAKIRPTVFEDLTPLHPDKRLILETTAEEW